MCRSAVVTGGSRRIGRAVVERLHRDGFNVVIHCNSSVAEASELAKVLNSERPGSAAVRCADLAAGDDRLLWDRCNKLIEESTALFGSIDVLVNNASTYVKTPLVSSAAAEERDMLLGSVQSTIGSNALAPFWLTRAFASSASVSAGLKHDPSIVNISDSMNYRPLVGYTMYHMAKAAADALTRCSAVELAHLGIRVNGVAPGINVLPAEMSAPEAEATLRQVPLAHRAGTPAEIASAVAFLVSRDSAYISGQVIAVDGAWSIAR